MTFALIGDHQYRQVMKLNISQIRKLHPEADIIVGDLGNNSGWECPVIDLSGQTERECFMMMKPLFLLHCVYRYGQTCLMDGDTVLLGRLDVSGNVVTVRNSRHGRVNSGVVWADNPAFVSAWLSRAIYRLAGADLSTEQLCEQSALLDVIGDFSVKEVPCDEYNYPKVESGIPDSVKIVHLKSGRFKDPALIQKVKDKI